MRYAFVILFSAFAATCTSAPVNTPSDAASDTPTSDTPTSDTPTSDTPTSDTPTSDTPSSDTPADTSSVQCSGDPYFFPNFQVSAKSCSSDGDCFAAIHQINCCGTQVAYGLNTSVKTAFVAAESTCRAQYPGCGCAQYMTMAEDGYSAFDSAVFTAHCQAGLCRSAVASASPECTAGGLQWPKPVKTCATTADCAFASQTIDCCGSAHITGIAGFAKAAYDAAQEPCAATVAKCGCPPAPTTLDDGTSLGSGAVHVVCVGGACTTGAP